MEITSSQYDLHVTFTTPVLGSQPTIAVASEFIAKRAGLEDLPDDEARMLPEELERGTTVFHRMADGSHSLIDYQIKGFLKEAGSVFNGKLGVKNLRSKLDNYVFITPRVIKLNIAGEMTYLERPLRAMTAQGPRVSLARSEMLPEGTSFTCHIRVIESEISVGLLCALLDYGAMKGLGQWRNGSYGQFTYELK